MILATVVALLMTQAHARRSSFAPNSVFGRQDSLDEREAYPAECQGSFDVAALRAVNDMCVQCENVTRDHSTLANCRYVVKYLDMSIRSHILSELEYIALLYSC